MTRIRVGQITSESAANGYVPIADGSGNVAWGAQSGTGGGGGGAAAGYAETVGDGVETYFDVEHNLGTQDVVVQVLDLDDVPIEQVDPTVDIIDADTVRVTFEEAPDAGQYRVLVLAVGVTVDNAIAVQEADGTPSVAQAETLVFPNGSLTDNGDGSVTVAFPEPGASDASEVTYTPGDAGDWDAGDPGNADAALDELAARTAALEAAPAPSSGGWEPLTNGDAADPSLVFADGDVIMVQMED